MTVEPLIPDLPLPAAVTRDAPRAAREGFVDAMARAADALASHLRTADAAEHAVAAGRGSIQGAAIARAQADVEVAVAAALVDHAARAITTVTQLQI
ncbi:MAG TPA: flagellar hook-basal body complex protein FliE [Candidatus Dormibacteraeota bacterium]|nr:flagellar hook-basal body complex protein FliE [Candidatus Dormibacteraeota bacterium]